MAKVKKPIHKMVKLQIPAAQANPSPPVGPALGQAGLNIMEFCNQFNDLCKKQGFEQGSPIPVMITAYKDKTFTFVAKKPPVSWYLKKAANLKKGITEAGKGNFVAKLPKSKILEIAREKMVDMNANDENAAAQMIAGSAFSMGIQVIEG
jgi:large subunit ribosomal protein L11